MYNDPNHTKLDSAGCTTTLAPTSGISLGACCYSWGSVNNLIVVTNVAQHLPASSTGLSNGDHTDAVSMSPVRDPLSGGVYRGDVVNPGATSLSLCGTSTTPIFSGFSAGGVSPKVGSDNSSVNSVTYNFNPLFTWPGNYLPCVNFQMPVCSVKRDPNVSVSKFGVCNFTSLGPKAFGHLLNHEKMSEYEGFYGAAARKLQDSVLDVRRKLQQHGYRFSINPAEPTAAGGSHGGEIVATKSYISSSRDREDVIEHIGRLSGAPASEHTVQ